MLKLSSAPNLHHLQIINSSSSTTSHQTYSPRWGNGPKSSHIYSRHIKKGLTKKTNMFETDSHPNTLFRRFYERGDLPISLKHGNHISISWKVDPSKLDVCHFLPIFIDGLREIFDPLAVLAEIATKDLIDFSTVENLLKAIPLIILPLKIDLETHDHLIILKVCSVLKLLSRKSQLLCQNLVPYYRQLLPVLGLLKNNRLSCNDNKEIGRNGKKLGKTKIPISEIIESTLLILERDGGPDALINIKYMIPTYESFHQ